MRSSYAEFGYDLACIVPFAYWHHLRGSLLHTVGVVGSAANFFFSPSHVEEAGIGRHQDNDKVYGIQRGVDGLNARLHDRPFQWHRWAAPDFLAHFGEHPLAAALRAHWPRLVIVHNKRSSWPEDARMRAELSGPQLDALLRALRSRQLSPLYVCSSSGVGSKALPPGFTHDHRSRHVNASCHFPAVLAAHGVLSLHDLLEATAAPQAAPPPNGMHGLLLPRARAWDFNEAQYAAHAAARRVVSNQGGSALIGSLFGGVNVVYDVWAGSGERSGDEYHTLHTRFSNATVRVATSFEALLGLAAAL